MDKPADPKGAVCALLTLGFAGCASLFPNMAEAIAPEGASLEEAGLGLLADIELWIETAGGWIAFLFGA